MNEGITLPELLLTLILLALLASIAMPRFDSMLQQNTSTRVINQLVIRIESARKQALFARQITTLCPGTLACEGKDDWIAGAILFADQDADGRFDAGESLLRRFPALDASGKIRWRSFGNRAWIQFLPNGSTPNQSGRFTYCPENEDPRLAREIIVNAAGRIRRASDADDDGVVESSDGTPVSC